MESRCATEVHDLVIVGSGPAGYTAAIYAARAGLKPLVLAGPQPGGQLTITSEVENYPGFPSGVQGPELMEHFREQAVRFGSDVRFESVERVSFAGSYHSVTTEAGESFSAHSLIISTGASAKWLGIPSEAEFSGYGVSACATCDGFFFRGKAVAVIGGGDTALEEALYLTRHATKVYVVHRRDSFRASKIMQERVLSHDRIEVVWNATVREIVGAEGSVKKVGGLVVDILDGKSRRIPLDGVFVAIGHSPNSKPFAKHLDLDQQGYVLVRPGTTETSVPGVFAAGDVVDHRYRQAVTAAGTGCMAALDAERYLAEHGIR